MGCCKRPPKMPSKTGVSRAEIAAHAFECSAGSRGGFGAIQGPRRECDKKCHPTLRWNKWWVNASVPMCGVIAAAHWVGCLLKLADL